MSKANQKIRFKPPPNGTMGMLFLVVGSVMTLVVGGFFAYIGLFLNANTAAVFDSTLTPTASSGALTWSGNSYCGDWVNITVANGIPVSMYINVTGINCGVAPTWADVISLASPANTSTYTATNISTAINANGSLNPTLTATNPSAGVVTLTYNTIGTAGNGVATTESSVNASWASTSLTGGTEGSTAWASTKTNVMTGYTVMGILFIIIGAAGCILGLMSVVGYVGGGKRQ